MGIAVEKIDTNKVQLRVDITPEKLDEGLKFSYNKNKNFLTVPGFRKGKAPRYVIEKTYGSDIFYEDAMNHILDDVYKEAVIEADIEPVSYPPEVEIGEVDSKKGARVSFTMFITPEVTVGQYKGFEIPKINITVTEEEVDKELKEMGDKNIRIVTVNDRPIKDRDTVAINFKGYIDNEPFEGGSGEDFDIDIGSHTFIDTFEEQLIGHEVGDDVDVHVTFPEIYHVEELVGKQAIFKVEILEIKEKQYPIMDDEFAQDVSEFDTLAELRENIKSKLIQGKLEQAEIEKHDIILSIILRNTQIDIPDVMIEEELQYLLGMFSKQFEAKGMSLNYYLQATNQTHADLENTLRETAINNISSKLVLDKIVKLEGLTVSDDEFSDYVKKYLDFSGDKIEDVIAQLSENEIKHIKRDFLNRKCYEMIKETVIEKEIEDEEIIEDIPKEEVATEE